MLRTTRYQNGERLDQNKELVYKLFSNSLITSKDYNTVVKQQIKREDAAAEQKATEASIANTNATSATIEGLISIDDLVIFIKAKERLLTRPSRLKALILVVIAVVIEEAPPQKPYPDLAEDLVPLIQRQIDAIPKEHLLEPRNNKVFESIKAYYKRLQNYAFANSFYIVKSQA